MDELENAQLAALRAELVASYRPTTPLQKAAVDQIVSGVWAQKLATNWERACLRLVAERPEFPTLPKQAGSGEQLPTTPSAARGVMALLGELRHDVQENDPRQLDARRDVITSTFGLDFFDSIRTWTPGDLDDILMAKMLVDKSKRFRMALPGDLNLDSVRDKLAVDPDLSRQFTVKLIDAKRAEVIRWAHHTERPDSGGSKKSTADQLQQAVQYRRSSQRALEHAVTWLEFLRVRGL